MTLLSLILRRSLLTSFLIAATVILSSVDLLAQTSSPTDQARPDTGYFNAHWRDSVNNYQFRLEAYHQEFFSYDWAMTFSFFPIAGPAYVNKTTSGIVGVGERLAAIAVATVGTVRLVRGSPSTGMNLGLLAGGLVGYVLLKWGEISGVQHAVSENNENLVDKWQIAEPDIVPGSIRYPTRDWPDWVTSPPPARQPQNAREVIDKPIPTLDDMPVTQLKFQIGF